MKSLIFPVLSLFLLFSCGEKQSDQPLIERNPEVKEYFAAMEEVVDEYCNMVEQMVIDAQAIEKKEEGGEEATFLDGLKMFENMGTSMYKMAKLSDKIDKMEQRHPEFEDDLSEADFKEFMGIYTTMIKRFYEMGKRLEEAEKDKAAKEAQVGESEAVEVQEEEPLETH